MNKTHHKKPKRALSSMKKPLIEPAAVPANHKADKSSRKPLMLPPVKKVWLSSDNLSKFDTEQTKMAERKREIKKMSKKSEMLDKSSVKTEKVYRN